LSAPMQAAMGALSPMTGMFSAPLQALQGWTSGSQSGSGSGSVDETDAAEDAFPDVLRGPGVSAGEPVGLRTGGPGLGASAPGGAVAGSPVVPSSALTSYSRPASAFASEEPGRPVGLRTGILSAATTSAGSASAGGPLPGAPVHGRPGSGRSHGSNDAVDRARVMLSPSTIR